GFDHSRGGQAVRVLEREPRNEAILLCEFVSLRDIGGPPRRRIGEAERHGGAALANECGGYAVQNRAGREASGSGGGGPRGQEHRNLDGGGYPCEYGV